MKIEFLNKEGIVVDFKVTCEAPVVDEAFRSAFKHVSAKASIPGFRKGHVPKNRILSLYKEDIDNRALQSLLMQSYDLLSDEMEKYDCHDIINSEFGEYKPNEDLEMIFKCECFPEVEQKDLSNVVFKEIVIDIQDSDIDELINTLLENCATYEKADDCAFEKDTVAYIDFEGKTDGVAFTGGTAKNFRLPHEESRMIPGFVDAISGHKAGESFDINVKFPDDYQAEELKGKEAVFAITINEVHKKVLPNLDKEFFNKFNVECESLEEFKENIKANVVRQSLKSCKNINYRHLVSVLGQEYSELKIPEFFFKDYQNFNMKAIYGVSSSKNLNEDLLNSIKDLTLLQSDVLKGQIVIRSIYKKNGFTVSKEEIEQEARLDSISYEEPEEYIKSCIDKNDEEGLYKSYESNLLNDKIYNVFREQFKIEQVKVPFHYMQLLNVMDTERILEFVQDNQELIENKE